MSLVSRPASRSILLAVTLVAIVACGSEPAPSNGSTDGPGVAANSADTAPVTEINTSASATVDPSGGAVGAVGAGDALASVGIGALASALESATKADRVEIDGDTIHLYLGDESSIRGESACIVTGAILSEGQFAVIHDNGIEFAC